MTTHKTPLLLLKKDYELLIDHLKKSDPPLMYDKQVQQQQLEKIKTASVLPVDDFPNGASRLYSTVIIRDTVNRINLEYKLMPPDEADEQAGGISALSLFGLALMGLQQGESFTWQLSCRRKYYAVVEVRNSAFI
ncbi:Transcription elongation factor, GreA/GreB, C-term [Chitinophaga eiseniae]|uniref:Transcription elongation factor, GreA/GreB, C-term n=1 Tax=Chitinophaga eiseniae TaxID=634771 RepID=A0A1T4QT78_9BACT|nr:GreA/GreB family elongation factor [Chitinophaga eiseniae]SKA06915.1 Transcription elongation factor, GreA/GreB, C-term [Chitinophaga eiseniae]